MNTTFYCKSCGQSTHTHTHTCTHTHTHMRARTYAHTHGNDPPLPQVCDWPDHSGVWCSLHHLKRRVPDAETKKQIKIRLGTNVNTLYTMTQCVMFLYSHWVSLNIVSALSAIISAIASEEVAAGEGAFRTCSMRLPRSPGPLPNTKSSTRRPSESIV